MVGFKNKYTRIQMEEFIVVDDILIHILSKSREVGNPYFWYMELLRRLQVRFLFFCLQYHAERGII